MIAPLRGSAGRAASAPSAAIAASNAAGSNRVSKLVQVNRLPGNGNLIIEGRSLNEWMVREGWALDYRRYSGGAYAAAERQARKAMLQLIRDVRERPVAFSLDGPRGPARVAQPGAVIRRSCPWRPSTCT